MMTNKESKKNNLFANKRRRLRMEMEVAEEKLSENINNMHLLDYIMPATSLAIPKAVKQLSKDPMDMLVTVDFASRQLLPENHWLRNILGYATTILRIMK